ncbi:cytochrome C oxidase subunit III, partial [Mycobacterium sp. ITM-2017-0098]
MTAPASAARDARRIPGESGTWVFLFGDMLVFGAFFVTFLVERAKAPDVFDVARTTLHLGVGVLNTLVLLTSSLCVVLALNAMRAGYRLIATRAVAAAMGFGLMFIALKVFEYVSLATAGHGPGANDFYLYYFILTGLHLFHVCLGLGALSFV